MPNSFALTTADENLREMFRAHREESRRQQEKLRERLEALKSLGLASLRKDVAAIASAEAKGVFDVFRGDKLIGNTRYARSLWNTSR